MSDGDIESYVEAAKRFCAVAELPTGSRGAVADMLSKTLTAAYLAALSLPEPGPVGDDLLEGPGISIPSLVQAPLRAAFGDDDDFSVVYDPTAPEDDDPLDSSLAQELAEIYEDLVEAIVLFEREGPSPDWTWHVRWAFEEHWGQHAMHVLPVLHQLRRLR